MIAPRTECPALGSRCRTDVQRPFTLTMALAAVLFAGCGGEPESESVTPVENSPAEEWPHLDQRADQPLPTEPLVRTLNGDGVDRFGVVLRPGDYFEAEFDQTRSDLVLRIFDSIGELLFELDSPFTTAQPEPERLAILATLHGSYDVEVRSWGGEAGVRYSMTITSYRRGDAFDDRRYQAVRADALGGEFRRLGDPTSLGTASRHYDEAAESWRALDDRKAWAEARLQMGSCLLAREEYANATGPLREAFEMIASNPAFSRQRQAFVRSELGVLLDELDDDDEARALMAEAQHIYHELGDLPREANALGHLGQLASDTGDLAAAERWMTLVLDLWTQLEDSDQQAKALGNLGSLYLRMGEYKIAWMHFRRAWDEVSDDNSDDSKENRTYYRLRQAEAVVKLGDLDWARRVYKEALSVLEPLSRLEHVPHAYSGLGRVDYTLGDFQAAEAAFAVALELAPDLRAKSLHRQNLARCAFRLGDFSRAEALFRQALAEAQKSKNRAVEAACHLGLAELAHEQDDLVRAQQSADQALDCLEQERSSTTRLDLRTAYFAGVQDYFGIAIGIAVDWYRATFDEAQLARSFDLAEQAHGRLLLDALAPEGAEQEGGSAHHLRSKLNKAVAHRRLLEEAGSVDPAAIEAAEQEELKQLTAYRAVHERVPAKRQTPALAIKTLDLSATQAMLDSTSALIQIALGRDGSFRWTVTANKADVEILENAETLNRAAVAFHRAVRNSASATSGHTAERAGQDLAKLILSGIELPDGVERLLIAVDGALAYVPFVVLPWHRTAGSEERLLIDDFEVVQIPSMSVVAEMRERARPFPAEPYSALVFGDPVVDLGDARLQASASVIHQTRLRSIAAGEPGFRRLRHAAREIKDLLALVPADARHAMLGFNATKAALLGDRLPRARIAHFATHGISDTRYPELSGLATSSLDASGRSIEDFVFAHEIQGLDLGSELAVLSACETGLGAEIAGEGLVGLAHSFMRAGVPRVVVSLWKVNDRATTDLMEQFYDGLLLDGASPGAALRNAQLALRNDPLRRRPFFWAAFVLRGDWLPPATPFSRDLVVQGIRP